MLHVNKSISIFGKIFPDYYEAISVADFLESRDTIEVLSKWRFLNPLSYATAFFARKVWDSEILAIVKFHNVNLGFEENKRYRISDLTGEFSAYPPVSEVRIAMGTCADPRTLTEGRYFEISIHYSPKNHWAFLETAKKIGPAQGEQQESLDELVRSSP